MVRKGLCVSANLVQARGPICPACQKKLAPHPNQLTRQSQSYECHTSLSLSRRTTLLHPLSFPTPSPYHPFPSSTFIMMSRALRRSLATAAAPKMQLRAAARPAFRSFQPALARRSVTTDAASSHADRENVPQEDDKPFEVTLNDERFVPAQLHD